MEGGILATLDISQHELKEGAIYAPVDEYIFTVIPIELLLVSMRFRYHTTFFDINSLSYLDIFDDEDGNGAIVQYTPSILSIEIVNEKAVSIPGYSIHSIEIYSNNTGEVEKIDLKSIIERCPKNDFYKYVKEVYEKLEEIRKGERTGVV